MDNARKPMKIAVTKPVIGGTVFIRNIFKIPKLHVFVTASSHQRFLETVAKNTTNINYDNAMSQSKQMTNNK